MVRLVSLERELAQREKEGLAKSLATGLLLLAGAAAAGFASLIVLLFGVGMLFAVLVETAGLPREHAAWLGPVLAAVVGLLSGALAAYGGLVAARRLKHGLPETSRTLRETVAWVKAGANRKGRVDG